MFYVWLTPRPFPKHGIVSSRYTLCGVIAPATHTRTSALLLLLLLQSQSTTHRGARALNDTNHDFRKSEESRKSECDDEVEIVVECEDVKPYIKSLTVEKNDSESHLQYMKYCYDNKTKNIIKIEAVKEVKEEIFCDVPEESNLNFDCDRVKQNKKRRITREFDNEHNLKARVSAVHNYTCVKYAERNSRLNRISKSTLMGSIMVSPINAIYVAIHLHSNLISEFTLIRFIMVSPINAMYTCNECGKTLSRKNYLQSHIDAVHNGVRHGCNICGKSYVFKGHLKTHIDTVHKGISYPCDSYLAVTLNKPLNSILFNNQLFWDDFTHHTNSNHDFRKSEESRKSECDDEVEIVVECEDVKPYIKSLTVEKNDSESHLQYMKYCYDNKTKNIIKIEAVKEVKEEIFCDVPEESNLNFDCDRVKQNKKRRITREFDNEHNLKARVSAVHNYTCVKYAERNSRLNRISKSTLMGSIMVSPINAIYVAIHLHSNLISEFTLIRFIMVSPINAMYTCNECGKTLSRKNYLQSHIDAVHNGVRHGCNICGKSYVFKGHLKTHIDTVHKGISYPCDSYLAVTLNKPLNSILFNNQLFWDDFTHHTNSNHDFRKSEESRKSECDDEVEIVVECEDVKPYIKSLTVEKNDSESHLQYMKYCYDNKTKNIIKIEAVKEVKEEIFCDVPEESNLNFDCDRVKQNKKRRITREFDNEHNLKARVSAVHNYTCVKYAERNSRLNRISKSTLMGSIMVSPINAIYVAIHLHSNLISEFTLIRFIMVSPINAMYTCNECGKTLSRKNYLQSHIDAVHNGVRHGCNICGKSYVFKGHLKTHIDTVHKGISYPCDSYLAVTLNKPLNSILFNNQLFWDDFTHHTNSNHDFRKSEESRKSECDDEVEIVVECEDVKPYIKSLTVEKNDSESHLQYMKYCYDNKTKNIIKIEAVKEVKEEIFCDVPEESNLNFDCDRVKQNKKRRITREFDNEHNLKARVSAVHNYTCVKYAERNSRLNRISKSTLMGSIMVSPINAIYVAIHLHSNLISEFTLIRFIMVSPINAMYTCNECGKTLSRKNYLQSHIDAVHNGVRHGCNICGKSYVFKGHLKTHIDTRLALRYSAAYVPECAAASNEQDPKSARRLRRTRVEGSRKETYCSYARRFERQQEILRRQPSSSRSAHTHSRAPRGQRPGRPCRDAAARGRRRILSRTLQQNAGRRAARRRGAAHTRSAARQSSAARFRASRTHYQSSLRRLALVARYVQFTLLIIENMFSKVNCTSRATRASCRSADWQCVRLARTR
ncbi:unnamed protein product [Trichogramma brassicae]|uniref:C2H2-type domain-containing protein n=1 Tax=Trichogramma brassicae TaxID=86971 RepID=A0A6H5JC46_9HYME|nr:unnamed protein product [Trichogramma brassicae]